MINTGFTAPRTRRLGFSIRALGLPEPSSLVKGFNNNLAFGANLMRLRDMLQYCQDQDIQMYRMHCNLAPRPASAIELTNLWRQYQGETRLLAELTRMKHLRLSFHPYSLVNLSTPDEDRLWRSSAHLAAQASMLDALETGLEAVIVLHVGGIYDKAANACERFVQHYEILPETIRQRIVLENDDRCFSADDVLGISRRCGIPIVFDWQHHQVFNPQGLRWTEALRQSLATWPTGRIPKIHFSSPRTELKSENGRIKVPSWTEHSDYVQPFEFITFLRESAEWQYDVMLECKARDLALLKLRQDLIRFAPDVQVH
ncbi:MAG: UV DNA damage repair endonuclease UvsE [Anaerolineae bacterium]